MEVTLERSRVRRFERREAWKKGRHVEHFGVKQIRVLTVTDSERRVGHMVDAVHEVTGGKGSNYFLFAGKSRLDGRLPTEVKWTTGRGELVTLTS